MVSDRDKVGIAVGFTSLVASCPTLQTALRTAPGTVRILVRRASISACFSKAFSLKCCATKRYARTSKENEDPLTSRWHVLRPRTCPAACSLYWVRTPAQMPAPTRTKSSAHRRVEPTSPWLRFRSLNKLGAAKPASPVTATVAIEWRYKGTCEKSQGIQEEKRISGVVRSLIEVPDVN